jgi:hypothetical protein
MHGHAFMNILADEYILEPFYTSLQPKHAAGDFYT